MYSRQSKPPVARRLVRLSCAGRAFRHPQLVPALRRRLRGRLSRGEDLPLILLPSYNHGPYRTITIREPKPRLVSSRWRAEYLVFRPDASHRIIGVETTRGDGLCVRNGNP